MKVKKGDNVIVIAGRDKGKKGKVVKALPTQNKVIVEGINMSKRRQRPRREGQKGQVVSVAMPLHVSNVMVVDGKKGERTRIGKKEVKGKTVRIAKKSGQEL